MNHVKDVVEEESVEMPRNSLVGVPLALKVIFDLGSQYNDRIPLSVAECTLEDTNGVLLHGRSTNFVLDKLKHYGAISIEGDFVLPKHNF